MMGLLEIAVVATGHATVGTLLLTLGVGLGLPAFFGLGMWWQVRRWQTDPEVRRCEPNRKAARSLLVGGLAAVALGQIASGITGHGWLGWAVGLAVVLVATLASVAVARRFDPRVRYLRRPDPLPEGEEPDQETTRDPARGPW